jgi:hypothetical protein
MASVFAPLNEREQQISADYEWCLRSPDVQRTYGGKVVAVHRRTIWAAAANHREAVQVALRRQGCPPPEELAVVFIEGHPLS